MKPLQQNLGKKIQVIIFDIFSSFKSNPALFRGQNAEYLPVINIFLSVSVTKPVTSTHEEPFQPWSLYQLSASTWRVEWTRHMLAIKRYRSNQTWHQGIKDLILRTMVKIEEKKTHFGDGTSVKTLNRHQICTIYIYIYMFRLTLAFISARWCRCTPMQVLIYELLVDVSLFISVCTLQPMSAPTAAACFHFHKLGDSPYVNKS